MKKKIFICSSYRGRVEENKKNAVSYARITAMSGDVPIVPHLYFPSFLDDNIPNERMTGIAITSPRSNRQGRTVMNHSSEWN